MPWVWGFAVVIGAKVYQNASAWWSWARGQLVVQLTVESSDDSFDHISTWLQDHPSYTLFTSRASRVEIDRRKAKETKGSGPPPLKFDEGDGMSLLLYSGRIMWITRWSAKPSTEGWDNQPTVRRYLRISTLGLDRKVLETLVAEAQLYAFQEE